MEKKNIYFENNGASIAMRYDMLPTDELDDAALERLKTNIPDGIAMTQYSDVDARRICYAYIPSSIQLSAFLKKQLTKVEVLTILKSLITSMDIGKFSIPVSYVVKDLDYVYIEEQTLKTFSFMIPIKGQVMEVSEIPDFLRTVVSYMKFSDEDTDNYVAKILTCINSERFSLNDINVMVSEMILEVGDAMQPEQPQGMARVDKLGVMRNRVVPPTPQPVQQFDPNMQAQQFGGQPQQPYMDPNMQAQQFGGQPQQPYMDPNMQAQQFGGQPQQPYMDPSLQAQQFGGQPQQPYMDPNMQAQQYEQPQPQQFDPSQQFDPAQLFDQPQADAQQQPVQEPVKRFDPMTGLPIEEPVAPEMPQAVEEPVAPEMPQAVEEPVAPEMPQAAEEPVAPEVAEQVQDAVEQAENVEEKIEDKIEETTETVTENVENVAENVAENATKNTENAVESVAENVEASTETVTDAAAETVEAVEEKIEENIPQEPVAPEMPQTVEEPVAPEVPQEPVVPETPVKRFDPMTGMPLTDDVVQQPVQEPVKRFDPMTGMPLTDDVAQQPVQEPVKRFDPMTGMPLADVPQEPVAPQGPIFSDGMFASGPMTPQEPVAPQQPVAPEVPQESVAPEAPEAPQESVFPDGLFTDELKNQAAPETPQEPVAPEVPQEPVQEEPKQPVQPPQRPDGEMNDEMFNIDDLMNMAPEDEAKEAKTPAPEAPAQETPVPEVPTVDASFADLIKPHFVREKTGEKIYIDKDEFKIGKSRIHSDYSIEKNTAISRVHVIVIRRNGVNYLKDNNSTNGTYVDGERLEPGREVLLKNDMRVKFGDEDFTFLLRDE